MSKSSAEQLRVYNQNGYNTNTRLKSTTRLSPVRASGAQRSSLRSDTFLLANNRSARIRKDPSRQLPILRFPVRSTSTPTEQKRVEVVQRNSAPQPLPNYITTSTVRQKSESKPIYISTKRNSTLHSTDHPVYYRSSDSPSGEVTERLQPIRVANDEVLVRRRRRPSVYVYEDDRAETPVESQRVVRVVREAPRQEEEVYYIEPPPVRRIPVIRKPTATEYIQVEEAPAPVPVPVRRRPEIVYLEEQPSMARNDEYMLVDETGREVSMMDVRKPSSNYVQYVYEDDRDRRRLPETDIIYLEAKEEPRSVEPQVVYLENEPARHPVYYQMNYQQPASTRYIYQ